MNRMLKPALVALLALLAAQVFCQPRPKKEPPPPPPPKEGYLRLISGEPEVVDVMVDGKNAGRLRLTKDRGDPKVNNDYTLAIPAGEHFIEVFIGRDKVFDKKVMIPEGKIAAEELPPLKKGPAPAPKKDEPPRR